MIKWQPRHRWEEVVDDLRRRILDGEFAPRSTIPGIPRLMQQYDIGRNTALRVIAALGDEGLVVVRRSMGTFVVPPEDRPAP
jgi:GntR family transcriptional regulator